MECIKHGCGSKVGEPQNGLHCYLTPRTKTIGFPGVVILTHHMDIDSHQQNTHGLPGLGNKGAPGRPVFRWFHRSECLEHCLHSRGTSSSCVRATPFLSMCPKKSAGSLKTGRFGSSSLGTSGEKGEQLPRVFCFFFVGR